MVADSILLVIGFAMILGPVYGTIITFGLYICLVISLKWVLSHLGIPVDKGFEATDDNDEISYYLILFACFALLGLGIIFFIFDVKIWGVVMISVSLITSVTCPLPTSRRDGTGRPEISFGILVAFALVVMFICSWQTMIAVFSLIGLLMLIPTRYLSMGEKG